MSTKSAIILSAAILIGTAAAGWAKQHPPFMPLVHAAPDIGRGVPDDELRGITFHSGEEAFAFQQGSQMFLSFPRLW